MCIRDRVGVGRGVGLHPVGKVEQCQLLSALNDTDECPKTIIYSLNPAHDAQIGTCLLYTSTFCSSF